MVCWRVGIRWYVFALVGLPVTMVLATFIRPGAAESFDISARPFFLDYLRLFISMVLLGGPLFEEPGWTGFAQVVLFMVLLLTGYVYVWRKGALEWA